MEVEDQPSGVSPTPVGKRLGLNKLIQASFGAPDDPDYVFDIAASWDNAVMAVSLSTRAIKLYSPITGQFLGDCLGHTGTISDILFPDQLTPHTFWTSSFDGTIRVWDTRNHQQVAVLTASSPSQEIYSFSVGGSNGNVVAAGAKAQVLCWDWRTKKELACMEECHTEDVTQVRFHPSKRDKLVTGSVDGLICIFDTKGDINDDEGLDMVMGVGTSVGRIGFHGTSEKLWCLTHIETLSIWNLEEGTKEADFGDTRSRASANWKLPMVDYLVHCYYSSAADSLWLVAGNNAGTLGYFPLTYGMSNGDSVPSPGIIGPVSAVLDGGHAGVIRTVWSPLNVETGEAALRGLFCWTGGEDGRLCSWSEGEMESGKGQAWVSSRLVMKKSGRQKHRHRPY